MLGVISSVYWDFESEFDVRSKITCHWRSLRLQKIVIFWKIPKKKFLSEWAEFLCVPKGHMWDSLCEITANFVNPPCLGEVLKFRKRAFFKCVPVKQF